jgi:3-isopropylmalate/(R)-2-methylmalate dehydratase small subunit
MKKFLDVKGPAAVWLVPNIDTDVITPMKRMLANSNELDKYAFESFRFIGGNGDTGQANPDFPLNRPENAGANILILGENFGCGSSRETAAQAISKMGYQCLIAASYGGIFQKNCFQQGILPITLPKDTVEKMAAQAGRGSFEIDLNHEEILCPDGERIPFAIKAMRKTSLLEGLDDVGMTLKKRDRIDAFFSVDKTNRPWFKPIAAGQALK